MSYKAIRTTIEEYFDTQWKLINPNVQIVYQNIASSNNNASTWIKLLIQPASINRISVNQCYEYRGYVAIQIFASLKTGMHETESLTDDVVKIFTQSNIGINFKDFTISFVGEIGQRIIQTNVLIEYATTQE